MPKTAEARPVVVCGVVPLRYATPEESRHPFPAIADGFGPATVLRPGRPDDGAAVMAGIARDWELAGERRW